MKRTKRVILTALILALLSGFCALANNYYYDGMAYTQSSEQSIIELYTGLKETVVIPPILGSYPTTTIKTGSFYWSNARTVYIPETVMTIEEYAFSGDTVLIRYTGNGDDIEDSLTPTPVPEETVEPSATPAPDSTPKASATTKPTNSPKPTSTTGWADPNGNVIYPASGDDIEGEGAWSAFDEVDVDLDAVFGTAGGLAQPNVLYRIKQAELILRAMCCLK